MCGKHCSTTGRMNKPCHQSIRDLLSKTLLQMAVAIELVVDRDGTLLVQGQLCSAMCPKLWETKSVV